MSDDYTFFFTAGDTFDHHFSHNLAKLTDSLELPRPEFRGKHVSMDPGLTRMEIETKIRGRLISPMTEDIVYVKKYNDWNGGLEMAMHDAMSRLCYMYKIVLPSDSFRQFGRRTADGVPIWYLNGKEKMTPCAFQLMEMEGLTANMEDMISFEMEMNDNARITMQQMKIGFDGQQDYINTLETTVLDIGKYVEELLKENVALKKQMHQILQAVTGASATPISQLMKQVKKEAFDEDSDEEPDEAQLLILNKEALKKQKLEKSVEYKKRLRTHA